MSPYMFDLLMPAGSADGDAHNASLLGTLTLGIEVTEPGLALKCCLGNIDPQHGGSGSRVSAIEAAMTWPLPPVGATLLTIRPDLDAFGAMAILLARAEGRMITPPMRDRVTEVGIMDRCAWGKWPGPRAMPVSVEDVMGDVGGRDVAVLTAAMRDAQRSTRERVMIAKAWLLSGIVPDAYRQVPQKKAEILWQALRGGQISINEAVPGRLVMVVAEADGALQLGYRRAPVVVALNPQFKFRDGMIGAKYTLAQYRVGSVDLDRVVSILNDHEPGWGGSVTIKGSPQGSPSTLGHAEVMQVVVSALV